MRTETQTRVLRPYDVWTGRDLVSSFHFSQILVDQATAAAKETTLTTGITASGHSNYLVPIPRKVNNF